jgi:hydroxymethylglutaryl-CoA lyase
MDLPGRVDLREVGLRDGLQLEQPLPTTTKLKILDALVAARLRRIEVTSFVSPKAVPALADAADVAAELHRWPDVRFSALVAGLGGARRAVDAGVFELEYVISAADGHSRANVGRDTAASLELVPQIAPLATQHGGGCETIIATAWDCPFDGPTPPARVVDVVKRAVAGGATRVCLADTIGSASPGRVQDLVGRVAEAVPGVELGVHVHNTRGSALACILTALDSGIVQIDASVGGLGGCPFAPGASGDVATEEVVYALEGSGVETGVDLDALLDAAVLVREAVGHPLQSNLFTAARGRDLICEPQLRPGARAV